MNFLYKKVGGMITLIIPPCLRSGGYISPPHPLLNRHPWYKFHFRYMTKLEVRERWSIFLKNRVWPPQQFLNTLQSTRHHTNVQWVHVVHDIPECTFPHIPQYTHFAFVLYHIFILKNSNPRTVSMQGGDYFSMCNALCMMSSTRLMSEVRKWNVTCLVYKFAAKPA